MYNINVIKINKRKGEVIIMLLEKITMRNLKKVFIRIVVSILCTMWVLGVLALIGTFVEWVCANDARFLIAISSLSTIIGIQVYKEFKI